MIGAVIVVQDWWRFHAALGEKALLLAESVAVRAPKAMLRKDYWSLYLSLKNVATRSFGETQPNQVVTGMILDDAGRVQAHLNPSEHPIGLRFSTVDANERQLSNAAISARVPMVLSGGGYSRAGFQEGIIPLFSDQKYLGVVRIRLSTDQLRKKAQHSAVTVLGLTLAFVIIGSLLGTLASRRMVKKLSAVTTGLEAVGRGDMTEITPIPVTELDEIGRLSATFNKIMTELAEKKELEAEIAMSEKLAGLGRIAAGVAHEVNNPLGGLLNCIDTLRKHPEDTELLERYLPMLEQGLHRIGDIVGSLLAELKMVEDYEPVSAAQLNHLRELMEMEVGDRNIEIIWENRLDEDVCILGGRVQQIVCNLLKNSIQALGDSRGTVRFFAFPNGRCMVIEISDDGPGIPAGDRNQLFDPFFTTKSTGTGLGLWVVYRLVQSMRGVIEVESEENRGTLFRVTIPLLDEQAT